MYSNLLLRTEPMAEKKIRTKILQPDEVGQRIVRLEHVHDLLRCGPRHAAPARLQPDERRVAEGPVHKAQATAARSPGSILF